MDLTEADSQLADKTRDLFAAVAQGTSCYDYKKAQRERQLAIAPSNSLPSTAFHGTVGLNMGHQLPLTDIAHSLQAITNSMQNQPLMQQNNIINNHRHQDFNARAPLQSTFSRRHNPISQVPRFGRSSRKYALADFTDSMHINMLKNLLEKDGYADHVPYLYEEMSAANIFKIFLA